MSHYKAVKVLPDHGGWVKVLPDNGGDHGGWVKVLPDHRGRVKVLPNHGGAGKANYRTTSYVVKVKVMIDEVIMEKTTSTQRKHEVWEIFR